MAFPFQKAFFPGAILAVVLTAFPAVGKGVYKQFMDPAIPHHAAILDTLAKIEKNPADGALHNDLGCLVARDGFWRDALWNFETAAQLAPKDSRPWFNAGLVEALRGDWGAARTRFRRAVKTDPGNWPAWWMLGYAQESLGHEDAAVAAYSRSLRVDTSLFDPKFNPFAVRTRLKSRVLLETYERRLVAAALPISNQLEDPSRVASFFQHHVAASRATVEIEEPPRTGPVVTTVPPAMSARPAAPQVNTEPVSRRRRAYAGRAGGENDGPIEVSPAPGRDAPVPAEAPPNVAPPGPGFGTGNGPPGTGAVPGPGGATPPPPGGTPRRVPMPGPGGPPDPEGET